MSRRPARTVLGCLLATLLAAGALAGCRDGDQPGPESGSAGASSAGSAGAASGGSPSASRSPAGPVWYLSVGDSLAFGYQQDRFTRLVRTNRYAPSSFGGYTAGVAHRLAATGRTVRTVNLGCPGETLRTFLAGGCPSSLLGLRLHQDYRGAQVSAAERFLRGHRGRVALVTVSLGANDLNGLRSRCGVNLRCYERGLPALSRSAAARMGTVLHRLRAADPGARLVVLLPYDPLAAVAPDTVRLLADYDQRLAAAATAAGARVADGLAAVNRVGRQPARVCRLTLYCRAGHDIHPSDAGYRVLAALLWRASGLGRG